MRIAKVLPEEDDPLNDRILDQLFFIPPKVERNKTILFYGNFDYPRSFAECPVSACISTTNLTLRDMDVYFENALPPAFTRPAIPKQLYMIKLFESVARTPKINYPDIFNWTLTYR